MQPSNSLDDILQHMEPSLLEGYKMFMHEVIIQGISGKNKVRIFQFDGK